MNEVEFSRIILKISELNQNQKYRLIEILKMSKPIGLDINNILSEEEVDYLYLVSVGDSH